MTDYEKLQKLVKNIDDYVCISLRYADYRSFEATAKSEESYYFGFFDAFYQFTCSIVDFDYTIQESIDLLIEDCECYEKNLSYPYYKGYIHASHKIISTLTSFKDAYELSAYVPVKHVFSIMYIDSFEETYK